MRTAKLRILLVISFTGLGLLIWGLCPLPTPGVSLHLCGYQTNKLDDVPGFITNEYYICAVVSMTNSSRSSVSYYGDFTGDPSYDCFLYAGKRWTRSTPMTCGLGNGYHTLGASRGVTFRVLLHEPNRPLRVSVGYSRPRVTDKLWGLLPYQLLNRVPPWIRGIRTASTLIDKTASKT
jgi:hypothetical protein